MLPFFPMGMLSELLSPVEIINAFKGSPGAAITPNLANLFLMPEIDSDVVTVFNVYWHNLLLLNLDVV